MPERSTCRSTPRRSRTPSTHDCLITNNYRAYCSGGSSPVIDYNCFHGCGYESCTPGPNDISSNPLFVDPTGEDCRLQTAEQQVFSVLVVTSIL